MNLPDEHCTWCGSNDWTIRKKGPWICIVGTSRGLMHGLCEEAAHRAGLFKPITGLRDTTNARVTNRAPRRKKAHVTR